MGAWSRMMPLVLLAALGLAAWWWKRRTVGPSSGILHVVRRTALLRGATLAVVEVGGRHFLVGATEHSVELLTELGEDLSSGTDAGQMKTEPWMELLARAKTLVRRDEPDPGFDEPPRP